MSLISAERITLKVKRIGWLLNLPRSFFGCRNRQARISHSFGRCFSMGRSRVIYSVSNFSALSTAAFSTLAFSTLVLSLQTLSTRALAEVEMGARTRGPQKAQHEQPRAVTKSVAQSAYKSKRSSRSYFGEWSMGVGAESFANEREQQQTAGLSINGKLVYHPLQWFQLRSHAAASLQSGYAQSQFGDNTPQSGVFLKEAIVNLEPFSAFSIQFGAINQSHLGSPLLVSERPFPGVLGRLQFGSAALGIEMKAQQTIPTSTALATRVVESEPTPVFISETATLQVQPLESLTMKVFGSHYAFRDLPSIVASDSAIHGNEVDESTPNNARFIYQFDGWLAGGSARVELNEALAVELDTQMIQNTQAPETYRNAQMSSVAFEISLPGGVDLIPKAQAFFIESDVAPAFYNSSSFGHNNRVGWAANIEAKFKNEGFKVGARLVDADVINFNLNQSRQRNFMIQFETLYEAI